MWGRMRRKVCFCADLLSPFVSTKEIPQRQGKEDDRKLFFPCWRPSGLQVVGVQCIGSLLPFPHLTGGSQRSGQEKERRRKGEKKESRAVKREREKGDEQKKFLPPFWSQCPTFRPSSLALLFFISPSHTPLSISGASAVAATIKHSAPHCSWGTKKAARIPLACKTH